MKSRLHHLQPSSPTLIFAPDPCHLLAFPLKMLPFQPQPSFSNRKRPRSTLKVQTASCLLSAAAVLSVSIAPLGTTASLMRTSSLAVTPTTSPAASPVVAYFGHDAQRKSSEARERLESPAAMSGGVMDINETDQDTRGTYIDSTTSYPLSAGASAFLLQVHSPTEEDLYLPPSSDVSASSEPRPRRSRRNSGVMHDRAVSSAIALDDSALSVTVNNNIASPFAPSSSSATATSSTSTPSSTISTDPTNLVAAPTSALALPGTFPQPFDQSLSYSLTASCVAFLARYLESEQMTGRVKGAKSPKGRVGKCGRPFGLLVSSSSRWAQM